MRIFLSPLDLHFSGYSALASGTSSKNRVKTSSAILFMNIFDMKAAIGSTGCAMSSDTRDAGMVRCSEAAFDSLEEG